MGIVRRFTSLLINLSGMLLLAACGAAFNAPTPTATFEFTGPTLEPSPTVHIMDSEELYGDIVDPNTGNFGQNDLTAAALQSGGSLPPSIRSTEESTGVQSVEILMEDGAYLTGDLYARGNDVRVPGVLLIAGDTTVWDILPLRLHAAGMTVMVVRMRQTPTASDIDTLFTSLSADGTVDPTRMAIISSEAFTTQALEGCAQSPICDAAVLLSPGNRPALSRSLVVMDTRPILVAVGEDDSISYPTALALASAASGISELVSYPSGRDTVLFTLNPTLNDKIVNWLLAQFTTQ